VDLKGKEGRVVVAAVVIVVELVVIIHTNQSTDDSSYPILGLASFFLYIRKDRSKWGKATCQSPTRSVPSIDMLPALVMEPIS